MANDQLAIDVDLKLTPTGTGDQVRVQPGQKLITGLTEVSDRVFSIGATTEVVGWDAADAAPAAWEAAVIYCLTADKIVNVGITGDAVLLALPASDKLPIIFPARDAGAATDTIDGKVTKIDLYNPDAAAIVVRMLLYGPEAA